MKKAETKSSIEIAHLASKLAPANQVLVLNSIMSLLHAQESINQPEVESEKQTEHIRRKK